MQFCWEWHFVLYILSDFPGIRNLDGLNNLNSLNNLSGLNNFYSLISSKKLTDLDPWHHGLSDTKMTYPGLLMWNGSWKIHYFIGFWHPFSWKLWRARNIKKIKIDELGINVPISWTRRSQNTSKNPYLYAHQSRITYQSLLWDRYHVVKT